MSGYVYFAHFDPYFVKIGYSCDPVERLRVLNTGESGTKNPENIRLGTGRLLRVMPGSFVTERLMHRRFESHRVVGEWFFDNSILSEFIASMPVIDPPKSTTKFVGFMMDSDLWNEVKIAAIKSGKGLAEWITEALRAALQTKKKGAA